MTGNLNKEFETIETRGKSCTTCVYCYVANDGTEGEFTKCILGDTCYDELDDDLKEMSGKK